MNEDTRVSVHCYEGDGHQVRDALELYLHHQCPVTIISPEDSQVVIPGVECRFAGRREGSVGQWVADFHQPGPERTVAAGPVANQRQVEQMKLLLTYPEKFFLMNDADSFCLSPEIPRYVYDRPDIVWCNYVADDLEINQPGYPEGFPHYASQPPYFLSRYSMEQMVAVADKIKPNETMPWIDHFMLQLTIAAGITTHRFHDSVASDVDRYPEHMPETLRLIGEEGRVFVHSSKSPATWRPMVEAHALFARKFPKGK